MSQEIKIPETKYVKYTDLACKILLVLTFLFLLWSWNHLPAKIPTHYNGAGEADSWGSKWSIWPMYIISLALYAGISFVERYPSIWNTDVTITRKNKDAAYLLLKHLIVTLKAVTTLIFCYINVYGTTGRNLGTWFLPVSIIITFGTMAYYVVRLVKLPK